MKSIVLVDDHRLIQQGLKRILESCEDLQVVGTGSNAEDGLFRVQEHSPDLAIIDLGLPDHSGLWLLRRILRFKPDTPVLILTMHDEPDVAMVAFNSGAKGYIRKSAHEDRLLDAVRTVLRGELYLEPEMKCVLDARPDESSNVSERYLTIPNDAIPNSHELTLLQYLSIGETNSQISDRFGVSVSTIKARLRALFDKLGVENRTEAVAEALRRGLIAREN